MTGVKRLLIVVGLCGLLALTGCSSVTVEVTVAGDATIDSYSVEATMPQTVFEQLQSQTENGQSVCDSVRSDFNRSNYDEYDCSTRSSNGNVTLEYQLRNWNTSDFDRITVSRTGEGNVTYVLDSARL